MFYHDNQTMYYPGSRFNRILIVEALKKLVIEEGGKIGSSWKHKPYTGCAICMRYEKRTFNGREFEEKCSVPVPVTVNGSYLEFVLGDTVYYIQMDENPFFGEQYWKTKLLENNVYCNDAYLEDVPSEIWGNVNVYREDMTDEDRIYMAGKFLKFLKETPMCELAPPERWEETIPAASGKGYTVKLSAPKHRYQTFYPFDEI